MIWGNITDDRMYYVMWGNITDDRMYYVMWGNITDDRMYYVLWGNITGYILELAKKLTHVNNCSWFPQTWIYKSGNILLKIQF